MGKVHALETQLITKEQSLKEYDNEMKTLQQELNKTRAARTQAEEFAGRGAEKRKTGLCKQRTRPSKSWKETWPERSVP